MKGQVKPRFDEETARTDESAAHQEEPVDPVVGGSEDVHIRNYDTERSYTVTIEIVTDDGEPVFDERYHLTPGTFVSEVDVLADGTYEIDVRTDAGHAASTTCRIDGSIQRMALIELGNGIVSATQGLY